MLWLVLLVCVIPLTTCTTFIYHYNYTYNPLANNVTLGIETFKVGSFNFSYHLNVWNVVDILSESGKL